MNAKIDCLRPNELIDVAPAVLFFSGALGQRYQVQYAQKVASLFMEFTRGRDVPERLLELSGTPTPKAFAADSELRAFWRQFKAFRGKMWLTRTWPSERALAEVLFLYASHCRSWLAYPPDGEHKVLVATFIRWTVNKGITMNKRQIRARVRWWLLTNGYSRRYYSTGPYAFSSKYRDHNDPYGWGEINSPEKKKRRARIFFLPAKAVEPLLVEFLAEEKRGWLTPPEEVKA